MPVNKIKMSECHEILLAPDLCPQSHSLSEPVKRRWTSNALFSYQLADQSELDLMIIEAAAVPHTAPNSFLFNKSQVAIALPLPSVTLATITYH